MFHFSLFFLYIAPFFGLCYTESDSIIYNLNLRPIDLGATSFEMKSKDALRAFFNKPLDIIVGKHELGYIKCYAAEKINTPFDVTHECDDDLYIIKVSQVTIEMSTKWRCDIQDYSSSTGFHLIFTVHVIGAEFPTVTIGGKYLPLSVTNSTETKYDGIVHYLYEDGENIHLQCEAKNNMVSLSYHGSEPAIDLKLTQDVIQFEKKLSSENNGNEIDCTIPTKHNRYMYRIKLQLNQPEPLKSPVQKKTKIAMYSLSVFILALLIMAAYFFWRQKTPKDSQSDKADLVINTATTPSDKTTDIIHEIHNNETYAISFKKLTQRENISSNDDPIYSEPRPTVYHN